MRSVIIGAALCLALAGCEATCQPGYTPVAFEKVPADVLRSISGFPDAKLDQAEEVSSMDGHGYRVFFHDARRNYFIEFMNRERATE